MEQFLVELYVAVLAVFVGFEVISKVPATLHTPLMSGTNAIHGIILLGAMIIAGGTAVGVLAAAPAVPTTLTTILGFIAVVMATLNVVGGFVVTDRMLQMFRKRPELR